MSIPDRVLRDVCVGGDYDLQQGADGAHLGEHLIEHRQKIRTIPNVLDLPKQVRLRHGHRAVQLGEVLGLEEVRIDGEVGLGIEAQGGLGGGDPALHTPPVDAGGEGSTSQN